MKSTLGMLLGGMLVVASCFDAKADDLQPVGVVEETPALEGGFGPRSTYQLGTFRANFLYGTYFSGEVASGTLAWAPGVQFNSDWGTRLLLGLSILKDANRDTSVLFLAPEIQLLTNYRVFSHFFLEVGGGLQKWFVLDGWTNPMLTANIHYSFQGALGPIDSVYVGYSAVWELVSHNQVRIGAQVKL